MLKAKLLGATAAAESLAIEDVFSTYLYTGNGSTQTITNGIDLAGEGGLVWTKSRSGAFAAVFNDTERGVTQYLNTTSTAASATTFAISNLTDTSYDVNPGWGASWEQTGTTYASWTFRQAPRFFDVVTYTGTGANRTIAHDLGVVPGCIIVKRTDTTGDWQVYHRSNTAAPETDYLVLNSTAATVDDNTRWNDTLPTSTVFSLGTNATVNASGGTYVAYLFAHDPLGPSGDGSDGLIACGSFTTDGSGNATVNLGWEPQWVLVKAPNNNTYNWEIYDVMRGFGVSGHKILVPNTGGSEVDSAFAGRMQPTSTGFSTGINYWGPNTSLIYVAIRRGPMREPTVGTEVFAMDTLGSTGDGKAPGQRSGFPVDFAFQKNKTSTFNWASASRLTGTDNLSFNLVDAASTVSIFTFDYMNGWYNTTTTSSSVPSWMFRRAPGFFDVVAYTGNGVAGRTVPHNLGVAPEMIIVKKRSGAEVWAIYHTGTGNTVRLKFDNTVGNVRSSWNDTNPTDSVFYVGADSNTNDTNQTYIAYLFASKAGVSKVGSYTGNGSSQTINCGFTTGARFVLIKRTDSTGDWYVWDTARGIVAANDPHLSLNTTAAEVTTDDSVDPASVGFIVNQVAATNINVSGASYIYLSIS